MQALPFGCRTVATWLFIMLLWLGSLAAGYPESSGAKSFLPFRKSEIQIFYRRCQLAMEVGSLVVLIGSVTAFVGTVAVSVVSGMFSYRSTKLQYEQAKLSVTASSSLALLSELGQRTSSFFVALEAINRLIKQDDYKPADVKDIAQKVNVELASMQAFLPEALAGAARNLGQAFDRLAVARGPDPIGEAVDQLNLSRSQFVSSYYQYREFLMKLAQPSLST